MKFSKELLKGSAESIVLQTLKDNGAQYGYQIIKTISTASSNIFEFKESTLYPLLYRLEEKGMITSEVKKAASGKDRRYYQITTQGEAHIKERKSELSALTEGLKQIFSLNTV